MCLIKRSWACSDQFAYNLRKDVPASISKLKIAWVYTYNLYLKFVITWNSIPVDSYL